MKIKKASKALLAAGLGVIILVGSAAADIAFGSGYEQLKDCLKTTTRSLAGRLDSYTVTTQTEVTLDDTVLSSQSSVSRYDLINRRRDGEEQGYGFDQPFSFHYFYEDTMYYVNSIMEHPDGKQYVAFAHRNGWNAIRDPFAEEISADLEKIADAAVGSLADVISVDNRDGKTIFSGHVTDAEIPALANALVAFFAKYSFINNYRYQESDFAAALTENVYVESVSGKAVADADGILESGVATITVYGTDPSGTPHTLTVGISLSVSGKNSTIVDAFDVTREDVELTTPTVEVTRPSGLQAKHTGTYKGDIAVSDETVRKTGECVIQLDAVTGSTLSGSYTIKEADNTVSVQFTGVLMENTPRRALLNCTAADGTVSSAVLCLAEQDHILQLFPQAVATDDGGFSHIGIEYMVFRQF